jgi:hypothetical protein
MNIKNIEKITSTFPNACVHGLTDDDAISHFHVRNESPRSFLPSRDIQRQQQARKETQIWTAAAHDSNPIPVLLKVTFSTKPISHLRKSTVV